MTLSFLLDTNICIYITKQKPLSVLHYFEQLTIGQVGMSSITYGELIYGASKSLHVHKNERLIEELTSFVPVLPIPIEAGKYYGEIRAKLEKQGKPVGNNDLWIAAHALSLNLKLVTNNEKEFSRIPNLKVENWVKDS